MLEKKKMAFCEKQFTTEVKSFMMIRGDGCQINGDNSSLQCVGKSEILNSNPLREGDVDAEKYAKSVNNYCDSNTEPTKYTLKQLKWEKCSNQMTNTGCRRLNDIEREISFIAM